VSSPVTNHALNALLAEAAYDRSHAAFARQVNRAGAAAYGLALRYDGASVYWWLRGRCPEQPAPELIAHVLSRRIGREPGIGELGFTRAQAHGDGLGFPATAAEAIESAASLWRRHSHGPRPAHEVPFVTAAATAAGWRWHFDPPDSSVARAAGRHVTIEDVEALRACSDQFIDMDRHHGGGLARTSLADFLTRDVAPLLRGSYTDRTGRALLAAAADLTGQAAFMSYDIGDHGAAQRSFIQALRLSKAAADRTHGAHILANMAVQAIFLSLPAEAVRLARAAVEGAGRNPPAAVTACLSAVEANAHALAGDLHAYRTAYGRAERALGRMDDSGPRWTRYFTQAHLAGTAMRSLLDLGRPAEALTHQEAVLTVRPGSTRTLALHTALTATVHARAGNIDQAASLAIQALKQARHVRSRRVTARITHLTAALEPHRSAGAVCGYLDMARSRAASA
jgi:tetratricopeptide (TPR) repeat protein